MKSSILMSMLLTFGLYFSSQAHSKDMDLEMEPLLGKQKEKAEVGLTWRDVESPLYDFYTQDFSCSTCCDAVTDNRCSCVGCVVGGVCGFLSAGCAAAVGYTAYHFNQIQKCNAWCHRGYQGFGWCTPDQTCFSTLQDCENSCNPSGNAYTIGLYSGLAGLVVTGIVTVSMCITPCAKLVRHCKELDDHNNTARSFISPMAEKYTSNKDKLLHDEDIQKIYRFLDWSPELAQKLNTQQKIAFDSIGTNNNN